MSRLVTLTCAIVTLYTTLRTAMRTVLCTALRTAPDILTHTRDITHVLGSSGTNIFNVPFPCILAILDLVLQRGRKWYIDRDAAAVQPPHKHRWVTPQIHALGTLVLGTFAVVGKMVYPIVHLQMQIIHPFVRRQVHVHTCIKMTSQCPVVLTPIHCDPMLFRYSNCHENTVQIVKAVIRFVDE